MSPKGEQTADLAVAFLQKNDLAMSGLSHQPWFKKAFLATVGLAVMGLELVPYERERHRVTGLWIWQLPQRRRFER